MVLESGVRVGSIIGIARYALLPSGSGIARYAPPHTPMPHRAMLPHASCAILNPNLTRAKRSCLQPVSNQAS